MDSRRQKQFPRDNRHLPPPRLDFTRQRPFKPKEKQSLNPWSLSSGKNYVAEAISPQWIFPFVWRFFLFKRKKKSQRKENHCERNWKERRKQETRTQQQRLFPFKRKAKRKCCSAGSFVSQFSRLSFPRTISFFVFPSFPLLFFPKEINSGKEKGKQRKK